MSLDVRCAVASRPKPGERECGDRAIVVSEGERHLIVVADGLGHGAEAAAAAKAATDFLREAAWGDLGPALMACHRTIAHTRGAAVTVLRIDALGGELRHVAVGNVELVACSREPIRAIALPGVVGMRVRRVLETRFPLFAGDVLLVHTDGVSSRFNLSQYRELEADALAKAVLARHAKMTDDATCVAVRC